MRSLVDRTRLAALGIIAAILLASSAAIVMVEPRLILGRGNDAGQTNTSLQTNTASEAFSVIQNGTKGVAIRGAATKPGGVGGAFLGVAGTGVGAQTRGADRYGLYATNEAGSRGTGAAIWADGRENTAIKAESAGSHAVEATSKASTALRAMGPGGAMAGSCDRVMCAGTEATGRIGVAATTATASGSGLFAEDRSSDGSAYAIIGKGASVLDGSLSVTDGCIGCGTTLVGRNGSAGEIHQGEAVTLVGVDIGPDGSTIVVVRPADRGDSLIGVTDRAVTFDAKPAGDADVKGAWRLGGPSIPSGATARIVTHGMMTIDGGLGSAAAGDRLVVGAQAGELQSAEAPPPGSDLVAGVYLGRRPDRLDAILVDIE